MAKTKEHYYHVLGLRVGAKEADIRAAYKVLAKKWHPDRNAGSPDAMERFLEIKDAHDALLERKTSSRVLTAVEESALELKRSKGARKTGRVIVWSGIGVAAVFSVLVLMWAGSQGRHLLDARASEINGDFNAAVTFLKVAQKNASEAERGLVTRELAASLYKAGHADQARRVLQERLEAAPEESETAALLGDLEFVTGHHDMADQVYALARKSAPNDPYIAARWAALLLRSGRASEGHALLEALAEGEGPYSDWARGTLMLRRDQPHDAQDSFAGNGFVNQSNHALATHLAGAPGVAAEEWKKVYPQSQLVDYAGSNFGVLYRVPNSDGTFEVLPLLAIETQRVGLLLGAGETLTAVGEFDEAIGAFQNAEKFRPDWGVIHNSAGLTYLRRANQEGRTSLADLGKAVSRFERAIKADDTLFVARLNLADAHNAYSNPKSNQTASKTFAAAIAKQPRNPFAYKRRADFYKRIGDKRGAARDYGRALKLDPRFGDADLGLGTMIVGTQYRKGMKHLMRATTSKDPAIVREAWRQIADYGYIRGDFNRSLRALTALKDLGDDEAMVHFHMARNYAKLGRYDDAMRSLKKANRAGFTDPELLRREPALQPLRARYGDLWVVIMNPSKKTP